jgi:pectin methylesterase-like acyl-CoA thioesterase
VTQAVAIQTSGDKHIFDHVALLSKLDTTYIGSTRGYFNNVYIEGTNDFIGGGTISVWENAVVYFQPEPAREQ